MFSQYNVEPQHHKSYNIQRPQTRLINFKNTISSEKNSIGPKQKGNIENNANVGDHLVVQSRFFHHWC